MTASRAVTDTWEVVGGLYRSMDEIKFFGGESLDEGEELPWAKDWIKTASEEDRKSNHEVMTCYLGDKGILLETGMFKSFIFKREGVYKYLVEALMVWVNDELVTKPLIAAYVGKKLCYGINESKPEVIWLRNENRFTSMRFKDDPSTNLPRIVRNPFLPPSNNPASPDSAPTNGKRSRKERPLDEATSPPK